MSLQQFRRHLSLFLLCVLLCGTCASAETDEENECEPVLAAFVQGDMLYAYADLGMVQDYTEVSILVDEADAGHGKSIVPGRLDSLSFPQRYLLLIDHSTSMDIWREQLYTFSAKLLASVREGDTVALGTFGERFTLLSESGVTEDEIRLLPFSEKRSDIAGGVRDAIRACSDEARAEGELLHIIVLSDGIPYGAAKISLSRIAAEVDTHNEVVVHFIGFYDRSQQEQGALAETAALGRGIHTAISSRSDAENAARDLMAMVNSLYVVQFPMDEALNQAAKASLVFRASDWDECTVSVALDQLLRIPLKDTVMEKETPEQSENAAEVTPDPILPDEPQELPDDTDVRNEGEVCKEQTGKLPEEAETRREDAPAHNTELENTEEQRNQNQALGVNEDRAEELSAQDELPQETDAGSDLIHSDGFPILIIVSVAAALAVILLILGFVLKRQRRRGVPVYVEPVAGAYMGRTKLFLRNELWIGSSRTCALRWRTAAVQPRHARIFLRDGIPYLEDRSISVGTTLGNMRINGVNRLRSGDEIGVGDIRFVLFF